MGRIICTYNVTEANESIKILNATGGVDDIYYNGNSIGVVQYYTFPTTGLHRLEFEESGIVQVGFANLDALVEVEIIGDEAPLYTSVQEKLFYGCANLKKVTLPNNLRYIYTASFYNCKSLQTITIPSSTERIYTSAFLGSGLEELIIEGCPNIELSAFAETNKLKTITCYSTTPPVITNTTFKLIAPNGTLNYPEGADYSSWLSTDGWYLGYYGWNTDNSSLLKCYYVWDDNGEVELFNETLTESVNLIRVGTDTLTQEDGDLSNWYASWDWYDEESGYLVAYIRLNDMTTIPDYFFRYNAKLAKVEIPESITSLGKNVFYDTDKLNTIVCYSTTPPVINESSYGNTFSFINSNGTLYYPEGADYSKWLSTEQGYLGYYGWNGVEIEVDEPDIPDEPEVTTPYVTGTTTVLYFNYDGTPKTSNEFDVYWYGDYYDRNLVNDSSHFGVSGRKIETTDDYVKYHYTVNCPQNTTSEVITGSCYFNIKLDASTYGESFVVEFIQDAKPEIPDIPDEPDVYINLEYNEITAPQGGVNTTLDVETNGVDDMDIIVPEWVDVKDKGGYYEIDVKPNNSGEDRTGEVIFVGNPNKSNRVQQSIIINQNIDSSEMAASISLDKSRITFDKTGYAESFAVKVIYTNAKEIYEPVCDASWVSIEKLAPMQGGNTGGSANVTSNRYGIYVTEATSSRSATVTFSCLGDNDRMISNSSFVVEQIVSNEPEGEDVLISAFSAVGKINYDGSSTGIAITSLSCGYKNATSILEPMVSADWIHLGQGVVQGGVNYTYDTVIKYPVSFDINTGAERVGIITFIAMDAQGNEYTATTTITQLASPVTPDEPEPDYPEGSDEETYSPIWKDVYYEFTYNSSYSIYTEVRRYINNNIGTIVEEQLLYSGKVYLPPDSESVKVMINKICQNYFENSYLPTDGSVGLIHNYKKFILKGEYGQVLHTYYFVNDWSYKELEVGIKTNPILPYIGDGQMLFFSAFADTRKQTIKWGMRYYNGENDYDNTQYLTNGFETVIVAPSRQKGVNQFYFGNKVYSMIPKCRCQYVLYYTNPYGGFDWFPITGKVNKMDRITQYTYTNNYNNTTTDFGKYRYLSEITTHYTLNTGFLTEGQSLRMWELLESNCVYLHCLEEDKIYPVIITSTEVDYKKKERGRKMLSYTIDVDYSQTRERI